MRIRCEEPKDYICIHRVNTSAFRTSGEANLVDYLRGHVTPFISLVAMRNDEIIGHILFTPVTLSTQPGLRIMGLGPMAVLPECQRLGIGSSLVRAGLDECAKLGFGAVIVLGHPEFYSKFGFLPSARFGIDCEFHVSEEVFMVLELQAGYLCDKKGTIYYHDAFKLVT